MNCARSIACSARVSSAPFSDKVRIAISFLLPASFYLRLVAPDSSAARALLVVTSAIAVVCTAQNLARMVAGGAGPEPEPAEG